MDPAIPEVPEVLRFQNVAGAMAIDLTVYDPHRLDLIVGGDEDWAVTYNDSSMGRPAVSRTKPVSTVAATL